jgi:hypothetical protein
MLLLQLRGLLRRDALLLVHLDAILHETFLLPTDQLLLLLRRQALRGLVLRRLPLRLGLLLGGPRLLLLRLRLLLGLRLVLRR